VRKFLKKARNKIIREFAHWVQNICRERKGSNKHIPKVKAMRNTGKCINLFKSKVSHHVIRVIQAFRCLGGCRHPITARKRIATTFFDPIPVPGTLLANHQKKTA